jgi:hypothetical protein
MTDEPQKKIRLHLRDPKEFESAAETILGEKFHEARARHRAAEERERHPAIGQTMKDGSIHIGTRTETKAQVFATPKNADIHMKFNEAAKYVQKLNAQKHLGHNDWRLPTLEELLLLADGARNGVVPAISSSYWSGMKSRSGRDMAIRWNVWKRKGVTESIHKKFPVRAVRTGPIS